MQLKGLVRFFAVALILISLYQLSFTFVVRNYEKKIKQQAENEVAKEFPSASVKYPGDKELQALYQDTLDDLISDRKKAYLDSTRNLEIAGFPWFTTYNKAKEKELNLGLDLQGGINVVLEVSVEDVIRALSGNSKDVAFNQAIERAKEKRRTSQADFVTLFGESYKEIAPSGSLATIFGNAYQKDINFNTSNEQVLNIIRNEAKGAIKNTYLVLMKRIDKFGVAQPNINLDEKRGIISVELAGVDDVDRVRKYLQASANLEFREVHKNAEFIGTLQNMNQAAALALNGKSVVADTTAKKDSAAVAATPASPNDTSKTGSLNDILANDKSKAGLSDSAKAIADKQAQAKKENPLFSILQPMIDQEGRPQPSPAIGYIMPKDTAAFRAITQIPAVKAVMPRDVVFAYGAEDAKLNAEILTVYALKVNPLNPAPRVSGERVVDARQSFDQNGTPEITMQMDNVGAREWKKLTGELKPKDPTGANPYDRNFVAIVLDGIVYSAPGINQEIPNGSSSISGSFTLEEAKDLANILKSGKMPAPAKIVQDQVVGPTLGAESVAAGAKSFAISFAIIFVLMLVYYNTAGIVANIALILNLLFTFGILASLGATLTMAGIAGLVLTIGMAVDTNVIIFERIKDELSHGKSYVDAVNDGYKRSYAPVLDGHVTSLITALILFYFGLGPVLGFATTQIIGLLLSLFCGILVSRMVTDFWMKRKKHFEYFTPISQKIFKHVKFDFVGKRRIAYIISAIVMVLGVASFFNGFDHGVDFSGGRSYTVLFPTHMKEGDVREKLKPVFGDEAPVVKTVGEANKLNITTAYKIEEQSVAADDQVVEALYNGLKSYYPANTDKSTFISKYVLGTQTVSPTISNDLRTGAVWATVLSIAAIFLYILLRFSKWQYSIGTIFSLLHDVAVTLAVFSFCRNWVSFPLEIDQHFIAAILTVIGFSMNDTVIVFDRIREYFRNRKPGTRDEIINLAINDTLSRTVMTSFTVFITILVLFIFGGDVTRGFAFAMLIGVITGTYSSIFVAAPILVDFDKKNKLMDEGDALEVSAAKTAAPAKK
ncbi:SecD/SecF fusion protein [Chitinophaga skermanii]|uniref:Multifunctional fusion protein n=1 Tax=Chitinophaga skermanii TaxID=331697 RepID=A0A327QCQ9_9BACT|nr:protein translocase subunit SecDF [Chitinophaga skermanii]RAJ02260.1 SecD/SecF fusion protein [Chitinophaga skermanii]